MLSCAICSALVTPAQMKLNQWLAGSHENSVAAQLANELGVLRYGWCFRG
jgi:hypothetical protein